MTTPRINLSDSDIVRVLSRLSHLKPAEREVVRITLIKLKSSGLDAQEVHRELSRLHSKNIIGDDDVRDIQNALFGNI